MHEYWCPSNSLNASFFCYITFDYNVSRWKKKKWPSRLLVFRYVIGDHRIPENYKKWWGNTECDQMLWTIFLSLGIHRWIRMSWSSVIKNYYEIWKHRFMDVKTFIRYTHILFMQKMGISGKTSSIARLASGSIKSKKRFNSLNFSDTALNYLSIFLKKTKIAWKNSEKWDWMRNTVTILIIGFRSSEHDRVFFDNIKKHGYAIQESNTKQVHGYDLFFRNWKPVMSKIYAFDFMVLITNVQ